MQNVPLAKAEVLRRAWEIGREKGGYAQIARASARIATAIEPSSELAWFALDAAQVLFSSGRIAEGMAWYAQVAADKDRLREARTAEAALWPFALFAGADADTIWDPRRLDTWYRTSRENDAAVALRRARALYAMLDAMGRLISATSWEALLSGEIMRREPGLALAWGRSLALASAAGHVGETVLLTTVGAAADGERTFASLDAARRAVIALRQIGLEDDARQLALETVMAAWR